MNPRPAARAALLPLATASFRRLLVFAFAVLALTFAVHPAHAAPQLVPGAYGYGMDRATNAAGFGTGSTIYVVSNFSDAPGAATTAGTLRHAVAQTGRRVILFNKSGVINLTSDLKITSGNVTIAGQSAPAPGVALHGGTLFVQADNVLVQHLRIRPGDSWLGSLTNNRDAADITRGNGTNISNVVFDHCTFMWSLDELVSGYWDYSNVAFNKCIFAEPLHRSIHVDEGTFPGHVPTPAQSLTKRTGSASTSTASASGIALGGDYELVNTTGAGQFVEYNLVVQSKESIRRDCHIIVAGITGTSRGRFRIEVRDNSGNLLVNDTTAVFDMRSSSTAAQTYAVRSDLFDIAAVADSSATPNTTLRVKLIVTGTSGTGYTLGVDHLSFSQGHAFGPLFSSGQSGNGQLSFTNNIFMNLWGRSPWVASKRVVIANNVLYNRGQVFVQLGHSSFTPTHAYLATIVGNSFIEGPSWQSWAYSNSPIKVEATRSGCSVYIASPANTHDTGGITAPALFDGTAAVSDPNAPYAAGLSGISILTASASKPLVLAGAGAHPASRDFVETRLINELNGATPSTPKASRPGSVKDSVAQAGGFPTYVVNNATWTLPLDPHVLNGQYTNLELWLHQRAAEAEGTASAAPSPPGNFLASPNSYNAVNLSWTDTSSNEDGFKIERRKGTTGTFTQIASVGPGVISYADSNLGSGTQYFYQIRSYRGADHSAYVSANTTTGEVTSGRVAHWKLNATSGTTVADETAGNNGTTSGAVTWVAGKMANGLRFDGGTSLVNALSGSTLDGLAAITVSAWIRAESQGGGSTGRILHKGDAGASTAGWRFLLGGTGALSFAVDHSTTDLAVNSANGTIITNNTTWQHVLATWNGASATSGVTLYINGAVTPVGSSTTPSGTRNADAAMNIYLGNDSAATRGFHGILDDVRVYNRVLTLAEIQAIHRAGL